MSLDLTELPTIKVHPHVHALLKAQSLKEKRDMNQLVRAILHVWAFEKVDVISMANEFLKSKDLPEITGDWDCK